MLIYNVRYHYRREHISRNFKLAIPISKTTGHQFITLGLPHSLFSVDLPVCMDVHCNPVALTIVCSSHINRALGSLALSVAVQDMKNSIAKRHHM